jgi:predicted dehydrogenase
MSKTIRVGIIGAGANTCARHIPGLLQIPGVEIAVVCNRSRESGEGVARRFGIPKVAERWDQVLLDESIDAIVIGTWPYMHQLLTCRALECGKHVLCEARMAMNAREAHAMLAASRAHPELVAQLVPSPFTLRYDQTICDLIADGFLGQLLAVNLRAVSSAFVDEKAPLTWRQDFDLSGYNTLMVGIYYEALMRWVGEARRVMAMTSTFVKQRRHPTTGRLVAVRVPEHVDIIAEMVCGAQANMQFSAVTGLATNGNEVWLFGSEGTLCLDLERGKLLGGRRRHKRLRELEISPDKAADWRVEEEFIKAIRGEEEVKLTTFADGVKYMEFTEAVALSAASGKAVHLPLP